jgi:hypothetical protein
MTIEEHTGRIDWREIVALGFVQQSGVAPLSAADTPVAGAVSG